MTKVARLSVLPFLVTLLGCGGKVTSAPDAAVIQNLSGRYVLPTFGNHTPCTIPGDPLVSRPLPASLQLEVQQDPSDLTSGSVTFNGTGELMLDTRAFEATFSDDTFTVEVHGPLSEACHQNYSISIAYDFSGDGARALDLDFEQLPACTGNDGHYCEGAMQSTFGDAKRTGAHN